MWAALGLSEEGLPWELRADPPPPHMAAVQEERQRGKDRNENEVESTSSANEDMPVEKILEAELAVEPKTETYVEANMGLNPNSVSAPCPRGLPLRTVILGAVGPSERPRVETPTVGSPADEVGVQSYPVRGWGTF